ncbi:MAG: hypothetical protein ACP5PT_08725 [Brevinematia bacterium]
MKYKIKEKNRKQAIFNENNNQVSDCFDEIYEEGLVKEESDYCRANKDGKWAIFHIDGTRISV